VKINIGMPEILIIFSLFMYSQSFWFSVIAFSIGVISRLCAVALDRAEEQEKIKKTSEIIEQSADKFTAFLATLGAKPNGFH